MWLSRAPDWPVEALVARWAPPPSQFIDLDGPTGASARRWPARRPRAVGAAARHLVEPAHLGGLGQAPARAAPRHQRRPARLRPDRARAPCATTVATPMRASYSTLMDQLEVQRFALAGNSLGGEVAWRTALLAPQRVTAADPGGRGRATTASPMSVPIGFLAARVPVLEPALRVDAAALVGGGQPAQGLRRPVQGRRGSWSTATTS